MNTTANIMKADNLNVDKAIKQWEDYQKLCKGILTEDDYQTIFVKEKNPETGEYEVVERQFKKKSAWQKLSRAFNVDTSIVSRDCTRSKNTNRITEAYYCVEATLPNGRRVESDALCSRSERGKDKVSDHTIMATAKTRATNRAIAELIGAGETSSEEMLADHEEPLEELETIETKTVTETETVSSSDDTPEVVEDVPGLIKDCIKALKSQGRIPTNPTVAVCIDNRYKDDNERDACLKWLNTHNVEEL